MPQRARTTDISLPLPAGQQPDPTIPQRAALQQDRQLREGFERSEQTRRAVSTTKAAEADKDLKSVNPFRRLGRSLRGRR
jgi:hypothetical protein